MEEMDDDYQYEAWRDDNRSHNSYSNMAQNQLHSPYNEYMNYNEHDIDAKSRSNYEASQEDEQPEHEYQGKIQNLKIFFAN